jgi:hypothetical protein
MRIDVDATVGIVTTKIKLYQITRKGYWRSEKWIKPKKKTKVNKVPLKKPFLSGTVNLTAYSDLVLGGVYSDGNETYVCVRKFNLGGPLSYLKNASTTFNNNIFIAPKELHLVSQMVPEKTTTS